MLVLTDENFALYFVRRRSLRISTEQHKKPLSTDQIETENTFGLKRFWLFLYSAVDDFALFDHLYKFLFKKAFCFSHFVRPIFPTKS